MSEVLGVIRQQYLKGRLDTTAANQAVADLRDWPGERFAHRWMLDRVWGIAGFGPGLGCLLRDARRAMNATLITLDARLARAPWPTMRHRSGELTRVCS